MANDPEIRDEIDDAKEDLRDALHQINDRVEAGVSRLRPDRGIRKHPDAAQTLLDRVYVASTLIVLAAAGVIALLASFALLLRLWMRWWQVLGLVGVCAIIAAEVLRRTLIRRASEASGQVT